jgi:hypothetical protein
MSHLGFGGYIGVSQIEKQGGGIASMYVWEEGV